MIRDSKNKLKRYVERFIESHEEHRIDRQLTKIRKELDRYDKLERENNENITNTENN